jgi:hypothetical protein
MRPVEEEVMREAAWLLGVLVLLTSLALAQSTYPAQNPPPTQPDAAKNPTNPSTQMPPDKPAPPPVHKASPQQAEPAVGARPQAPAYPGGGQVAAGTEIRATLDTPLSTGTSRVGDQFTATVAQPVSSGNGAVAVPAGSKIRGEVVQAEAGKTLPSVRGRGRLNLRFRDVTLPDGVTQPLTATLISGLIFGHALRGLAIGAIAGGGYVLAEGGKDVNLPADTGLVLRLDQPLNVPTSPGR